MSLLIPHSLDYFLFFFFTIFWSLLLLSSLSILWWLLLFMLAARVAAALATRKMPSRFVLLSYVECQCHCRRQIESPNNLLLLYFYFILSVSFSLLLLPISPSSTHTLSIFSLTHIRWEWVASLIFRRESINLYVKWTILLLLSLFPLPKRLFEPPFYLLLSRCLQWTIITSRRSLLWPTEVNNVDQICDAFQQCPSAAQCSSINALTKFYQLFNCFLST